MISSIALVFPINTTENTNRESRLSRRILRDVTNVLEIPEDRFIANFRVNKEVFSILLDEMGPKMKQGSRSSSIPDIIKLSTFLKFLASGGYQFSVGNECISYISKSKVSIVISECLDICEQYICPKWITLEKNAEEENKTKEWFFNRAGIPGVVGCIDGTHVRMKSPGQQQHHLYYNRKGFYSINVMAICDQNMVINYVHARHPGTNHDAFVWDQSSAHHFFKMNYLKGKRNTWLLSDSGYKLQPYVMTPYRNATDERHKKFNEKHCKWRNIIERCFGVLKNRFRCIIGSRGLHYSPQKTTKIINTCCALHNMCIFYKNHWLPYEIGTVNDDDEYVSESSGVQLVAATVRDEISRNLIL